MIQVRALAKSQGETISKEQVHNKFLPLNVEDGQFLLIFRYLNEEKITLYDTEEERLAASEHKHDGSSFGDNAPGGDRDVEDDEREVSVSKEDGEYLKMYIGELDSLDIPNRDDRNAIIEDILKDRDSAAGRLPNL